jgi:hypothetical protein
MIDSQSKERFKEAGFTDKEINVLADAQAEVSAFMPAWMSVLRTREFWVSEMKLKGLTSVQIRRAIDHYYDIASRKDSSPFSFLKMEYQPVKTVTDFKTYNDRRKRDEARIMRKLNQSAAEIERRG